MSSPLGNQTKTQQPGEAFHVLFTSPAHGNMNVKENERQSTSPLARSASKQPETNTNLRTFRDYTPRKSGFSPRGNGKGTTVEPRETQTPPPPTMSLFDTGAFQKSTGMERRAAAGREGELSATALQTQRMFSQPASSVGALVEDYESTWVQVYGFNGNDLPLVLREFSKCGEIVDFGQGADGPYVNWVFIGFDSKFGAQRALLRSGYQLSPTCMVGVKEVDDATQEMLGWADRRELVKEMLRHEPKAKAEQKRSKKLIAAGEEPVVAVSDASLWERFNEFVLGL